METETLGERAERQNIDGKLKRLSESMVDQSNILKEWRKCQLETEETENSP